MEINLIKIGNSKGIRIPAPILEQCGFEKSVELTVEENALVIKPAKKARQGWGEAFKERKTENSEPLLIPDTISNQFDTDEWTW